MTEQAMVERVEAALENAVLNPFGHRCSVTINGDAKLFYAALARAALKAMREPTEAMREAISDVSEDRPHADYWRAGIDAALAEQL